MTRLFLSTLAATPALLACAPDTRMPESSYQWERRQERIERDWRGRQPTASQTPTTPALKDKP